jgi:hypothetical protein
VVDQARLDRHLSFGVGGLHRDGGFAVHPLFEVNRFVWRADGSRVAVELLRQKCEDAGVSVEALQSGGKTKLCAELRKELSVTFVREHGFVVRQRGSMDWCIDPGGQPDTETPRTVLAALCK